MTDHEYSVRVKNGAGWRGFDRLRLMISVGQEYHEGAKLAAVVSWLNRNPTVREVHVSVNDLLQRHNYVAVGMPETDAAAFASAEGSLWLARNDDTLSAIQVKTVVTRWADWVERPDFDRTRAALLAYADANPVFADLIARDALTFATRKAGRGERVPDRLVAHSQEYLEEETAVFAIQTREMPAAEIYPGSNLSGTEYLLRLPAAAKAALPEPIRPLGDRYFTRIDFSRINVAATAMRTAIPNLAFT